MLFNLLYDLFTQLPRKSKTNRCYPKNGIGNPIAPKKNLNGQLTCPSGYFLYKN